MTCIIYCDFCLYSDVQLWFLKAFIKLWFQMFNSCQLLETLQQFKVLIFRLHYSHFQSIIIVPISKNEVQVSLPPSLPPSLSHSLTQSLTWSLTHLITHSVISQSISQLATYLLFHLFTQSLSHSVTQLQSPNLSTKFSYFICIQMSFENRL